MRASWRRGGLSGPQEEGKEDSMQSASRLGKIRSPEDLKGLSIEALEELAREIRQVIAQTCSRNGGHFAPSLGAVELTIALHRVFSAPRDKIVWDVGHQAYAHKLLTGRADEFHTLRLLDGLSGFPRREESPYDCFGVGHASTAVSAALGMAIARDQRGDDYRVVAVCGDGAMTGGLCYEALNNLGYRGADMLIVLNDNAMSIAPNIGAIARHFHHLVTADFYNKSKRTAKSLIGRVPIVGEKIIGFIRKVEASVKDLILPEETVFEKMGIRYLGPVDGHNLRALIDTLEHIRNLRGPMLLHVKTLKGKGYSYSESDPELWHSGADFAVDTGEKTERVNGELAAGPEAPTYTEVFGRTLVELADTDERIVAITAAMPSGTGLSRFARRFPDRFHDVGIAEAHAVCFAAGLACEGLRPVVAIYSTFLQRAFDQIIHDVALQNLPVTFAIDRAGIVGDDGPTHHGVFDLSYLRMVPNLVVAAPRDEEQLRRIAATAAAYDDGPFAYRYPRGRGQGVKIGTSREPVEIGRGEILREPPPGFAGPRVAVFSIGVMAAGALAAAEELSAHGIELAVIDMRFVKPLDRELIERFGRPADRPAEYDLLATVEENVLAGGFGSAVSEAMAEMGIERRVLMIGLPDRWIEHGPIAVLRSRGGIGPEEIAKTIRRAVETRSGSASAARVGVGGADDVL